MESPEVASEDVEKFREVLKSSQHIIVIAGAGLSAASGELNPEIFGLLSYRLSRYPHIQRQWRFVADSWSDAFGHCLRFCKQSVLSVAILSSSQTDVRSRTTPH